MNDDRSRRAAAQQNVTHQLARYALETRWDDFPQKVQEEAHRAVLNIVGCAIGGSNAPMIDRLVAQLQAVGSGKHGRVIGRREILDIERAALVNCTSAAVHAFDDTHLKTITHPTGPVAAAALAIAETRQVCGKGFLTAVVVGMELECRLSTTLMGPNGASGGWYITGVTGGIGAAAASARLLGLDLARTVHALGHAATQACGLRATHASNAAAIVPGFAARNGLSAALLAEAGISCSDHTIDGKNGLFRVMAPNIDPALSLRDLGRHFEFLNNAYKPYPAGIVVHPAIDACLEIATLHRPDINAIVSIELEVNPTAYGLALAPMPQDAVQSQVSLPYWAAACLVAREAGVEQTESKWLFDERVTKLQSLVSIALNSALERDQALATVTMKSGETWRSVIEHATGSLVRPMTPQQVEVKFQRQVEPVLGAARSSEAIELLNGLARLDDMRRLLPVICLDR